MTDDRPTTTAEILALPTGPHILRTHEWTLEDCQRGHAVVNGKTVPVRGKCYAWHETPEVICTSHKADDVLGCFDDDGSFWTLGQWADGRWFRERQMWP